jgi:YidC/Oxa1 family membrane protein insertase
LRVGNILQALQALFGPIGTLFHYLFYLPVFNILMGVYMVVHSFALAIVILTLLLRVAMIPLTRAQLKSQQEMQKLAPELARIKREHPNDPQAQMAAQQALYREHGVSPMKGCLPLLIQMPFLYALYYSFYTVVRAKNNQDMLAAINRDLYPFMPHLTLHTLPSMQFFWTSLATADPVHILPVLAAVLTFIQLRMAMPVKKPQPRGAQADATTQAAGTMQYMMPFITLFIGWGFPAGLALYWCISTGFSAVQQYFLNGNFGSLFVGVPGMAHLVPPPKDLTTINTPTLGSRGTSSASGSAGGRASTRPGAKSSVPVVAPEPPPSGLRGFLQQLRESVGAAGQPAQAPTQASLIASATAGDGASDLPRPPRRGNGTGGPGPRRPRPTRERAMLVRGATEPTSGAEELPENEIARAGASTLNGKTVLPEQAIADEMRSGKNSVATNGTAAKGTTANGTAAKGAANGARPPSGAASRNGTAPHGAGASNGQYYRKGSSSGRKGGRPKGGR